MPFDNPNKIPPSTSSPLLSNSNNPGDTPGVGGGKFNGRKVSVAKKKHFFLRAVETAKNFCLYVKSLCCRGVSVLASPFIWLGENRFGLAKLTGIAVLPAQFLIPFMFPKDHVFIGTRIKEDLGKPEASKELKQSIELLRVNEGKGEFDAFIFYPEGIKRDIDSTKKQTQCILFHNPNGCVLESLLDDNLKLSQYALPGFLQQQKQCPVIVYDYRGSGMNSKAPFATAGSIVKDGCAVLEKALDRFDHVCVAGSSLGGGVGAESTEKVISKNGISPDRVSIVSHDSFTSTARVVLPGLPNIADGLGWLMGAQINARKAIKKLHDRKVSMVVMNHTTDEIIPRGARMSEYIKTLKPQPNCRVIESDELGGCTIHCELGDFKKELKRIT